MFVVRLYRQEKLFLNKSTSLIILGDSNVVDDALELGVNQEQETGVQC